RAARRLEHRGTEELRVQRIVHFELGASRVNDTPRVFVPPLEVFELSEKRFHLAVVLHQQLDCVQFTTRGFGQCAVFAQSGFRFTAETRPSLPRSVSNETFWFSARVW